MVVTKAYNRLLTPEMVFSDKTGSKKFPGFFVPSVKHRVIHNFIHQHLIDLGHAYAQTTFRSIYDLLLLSQTADMELIVTGNKKRQKLISYLAFAQKSLGTPFAFYKKETLCSRFFCAKADLFLKNKFLYKCNRAISYIMHRVYNAYIYQGLAFFYDKSVRRSIIRRLSAKDFYSAHIQTYKQLAAYSKTKTPYLTHKNKVRCPSKISTGLPSRRRRCWS
jgi:hypothetical protein